MAGLPAYKRQIGLVFQNYALFPHLSVASNVAFGLKVAKRCRLEEISQKVASALAIVGLEHLAERYPAQLSGGQQQRVAIARSIVLDPHLLLLDEPLSNLDFKLRIQMREELRKLQRRLGTTFVYVTHDQTEAMAMSDRIVVLSGGRIAQIGTPREIYDAPATKFVADFIGASNLLKVVASGPAPNGVTARTASGATFTCARGDADKGQWISIRPESIKLAGTTGLGDDCNRFRVQVLSRTFCGERDEVSVRLVGDAADADDNARPIVMHVRPQQQLAEELDIQVDPRDAVLVAGD
jgi:putative spermidine/putrescine transport system ATP-binding protein